jgi:hypothetical protein
MLAFYVPAFVAHIAQVVDIRTEKKVARIPACWSIAMVTDVHPLWNWAYKMPIRPTMDRRLHSRTIIKRPIPSSLFVDRSLPQPAAIRIIGDITSCTGSRFWISALYCMITLWGAVFSTSFDGSRHMNKKRLATSNTNAELFGYFCTLVTSRRAIFCSTIFDGRSINKKVCSTLKTLATLFWLLSRNITLQGTILSLALLFNSGRKYVEDRMAACANQWNFHNHLRDGCSVEDARQPGTECRGFGCTSLAALKYISDFIKLFNPLWLLSQVTGGDIGLGTIRLR